MSDLKWYAVWNCPKCGASGVTDNWQTPQLATKRAVYDHERQSPECDGALRITEKKVKPIGEF